MSDENTTARVQLSRHEGVTLHLFYGRSGTPVFKRYPSEEELPSWVLDKLALLKMIGGGNPTDYVDGVGRRLSDEIFWIEE
jgi:hypothetical protein